LVVARSSSGEPWFTSYWEAIEAGEDLRAALDRELLEETGLAVHAEPRLAFSVEVRDAGVIAHTFECEVTGAILPNDPDGFVQAVEWIEADEALARLDALDWYDTGPLRAWLGKA